MKPAPLDSKVRKLVVKIKGELILLLLLHNSVRHLPESDAGLQTEKGTYALTDGLRLGARRGIIFPEEIALDGRPRRAPPGPDTQVAFLLCRPRRLAHLRVLRGPCSGRAGASMRE